MNDTSANPIFVALLFILRCVVPLAILFGISYLLRKMGLVVVEAPEPPDESIGEVTEPTPAKGSTTGGVDKSKTNPNEPTTVENNKES